MEGHDNRCRFADIRKVKLEPFQIIRDDSLIVGSVTSISLRCNGIRALDIVKDDIVDLSDVEGIVVRTEFLLVPEGRIPVADRIHVMVMVADCVEDLKTFDDIGIRQILVETVFLRIPVKVPGHVSESHGVDLVTGILRQIVVDLLCESCELIPVILLSPSKMDVSEEKHRVIGLVSGLIELEITPVHFGDVSADNLVEQRQDAGRGDLVTARNGDEDVRILLFGLDLVHTVLVGKSDDIAIGDSHTLDSLVTAAHLAVNVRTRGRSHPVILEHSVLHLVDQLRLAAPLDAEIVSSADKIGPDHEGEGIVGQIADRISEVR